MKKIFAVLLSVSMLLAVTACGQTPASSAAEAEAAAVPTDADTGDEDAPVEEEEEAPAEEEKLVVAQTVIDLSNVFFVELSNGVKEACEERGFEFILHDGKSDAAQQISAIENFIVQQVDVLVITPVDPVAVAPILQEARDAGITIINCNQEVDVKDAFILVPEYIYGYTAGQIAAEWINENLGGDAKVGILNRPVSEPLVERSNGFMDGVTENSNAEIVAEQAAHTADLGLQAVESILQSNPDINGFICQNDTAALGAYEALVAAGRDGSDTFVVGVDGLEEALNKIAEGGIFIGTVDSNPFGMGKLVIETALEVRANGPVEENINPEIIPVTESNIAQYVS